MAEWQFTFRDTGNFAEKGVSLHRTSARTLCSEPRHGLKGKLRFAVGGGVFGIVFEKCSLDELDERTYEDRAGERRIFDKGGGPWKAGSLEGYHGQIYDHGVSNRVPDHVRPSGQ